ncbi:MAG: M24 family metallopeptidase [Flavobacteriaceae bacterium]|jgi:Xaa-Pro aminopeptidase|nr:M24 family metallopeptidase [Flavobacteriaceae bacterium]MBT4112642.1 M24 family metallopeptidase [Flavobacteriaceae bacterium]MBT4614495.1 M24 family metallopeptidase [Flavobacteriaceae bacterium]MBT5246948.1 M24 family metallopeptidase [Flavobacteriaceae bacterium]MBT5650132.1 M24 family metallopeptidase [Flavobacteriaceae bacterium]
MKKIFYLVFLFTVTLNSQNILEEKERAKVINEILKDRFENVLPKLMDKTGIDMWILISREYNEDPVLKTMLPAEWLNARRRTIILFYRDKAKNTLDKLAVARYNFGENIISAWDKEVEPNQWKRLNQLIEERNPKTIGINYSKYFNIADGIDKTDYEEFVANISKENRDKIISAQKLATAWIETRTAREMEIFSDIVEITHNIIKEAFSSKVIEVGATTTTDVEWWMRQKVTNMGLETWFHPSVDIQRNTEENKDHLRSFSNRPDRKIIQKGDLLHCDFGITYLRLNSDCQQMAYVMKDDETEVPVFLKKAFNKGNKLQDILTSNFIEGDSGNTILLNSLNQAVNRDLRPSIYTHPLGSYGHSSGPTIGMWDSQDGVKGNGDYPLHKNTVYAIELNITSYIKEWSRDIRIMLEEAGYFGEEGFRYVNQRQTEIRSIYSN